MANIDSLVFAGAALLLLAILASAVSYRIGMPLLLVFLAVGMLAGEDVVRVESYSMTLAWPIASVPWP